MKRCQCFLDCIFYKNNYYCCFEGFTLEIPEDPLYKKNKNKLSFKSQNNTVQQIYEQLELEKYK